MKNLTSEIFESFSAGLSVIEVSQRIKLLYGIEGDLALYAALKDLSEVNIEHNKHCLGISQ